MMLTSGWSQTDIKNHFNELMGEEHFSNVNISRHKRNHLSVQDAAVRRIIEARARQFGMDVDAAEGMIMTKAGAVDAIIHRGMEAINSGSVEFKAGEVLQAIQLLDKMEAEWKDTAIDEIMAEFRAFTQAVKEVVGEDQYALIFGRFEQILDGKRNPALSPPVVQPSTIEGEVVEEESS